MKKFIFIIVISFPLFLVSQNVSAMKSSDFIDSLSEKIIHDCNGSSIEVKQGPFLNLPIVLNNKDEVNFALTKLSQWPFRNYIEIEGETKSIGMESEIRGITKDGSKVEFSTNGKETIVCKNLSLDINGQDFIWGGAVFDMPKKVTQNYLFKDFTLFGLSVVSNGGFTLIGWSFIGILELGFMSIVFLAGRKTRKAKDK